jgi:hypothetical protein
MKKLVLLALCFVFMLTACSNYRIEIIEPESGAQSSGTEAEMQEEENPSLEPEIEIAELTEEQKQLIAAALEKLAKEYNEGAVFLPSGLEFPSEITTDDFTAERIGDKDFNVFLPVSGDTVIAAVEIGAEGAQIQNVYAQSDIDNPADHSAYKTGFSAKYANEELGFEVDFPNSWADNYEPVVTENVTLFEGITGTKVGFFYKDTRETDPWTVYSWSPLYVICVVDSENAAKIDAMDFTGMNKCGVSEKGTAYYEAIANGEPSAYMSKADAEIISKMERRGEVKILN